jgi:hypothetical protein
MRRLRFIMKRVIMLVILGAIINVAVAWGVLFWRPQSWSLTSLATWEVDGHKYWTTVQSSACASVIWTEESGPRANAFLEGMFGSNRPLIVDRGSLPRWSLARSDNQFVSSQANQRVKEIASGWPLPTLHCTIVPDPLLSNAPVFGGIRLPPVIYYDPSAKTYGHRALPCVPIWPGFAINTAFYAAILWLLFAAPFALRRRFVIRGRVRRGQCPACAYPVGSSTVCTECGKALPSPSR